MNLAEAQVLEGNKEAEIPTGSEEAEIHMGSEEAEIPTVSNEVEIPTGSKEAEIPKWYQSINISSLPHCKNVTDLLVHIITQPKYVQNLKDRTTRKKEIWVNIAKEMKKYGYPLNLESDSIAANKCSQKLRNLKKWYNRLLHIHKCDENDLPECLAKLRKVFDWKLDAVGR